MPLVEEMTQLMRDGEATPAQASALPDDNLTLALVRICLQTPFEPGQRLAFLCELYPVYCDRILRRW